MADDERSENGIPLEAQQSDEERRFTANQQLQHMADVRSRVDTLAKSVFLISGGALTVALGIFMRESAPSLSHEQTDMLHYALYALFISMALFSVVVSVMIYRAEFIRAILDHCCQTRVVSAETEVDSEVDRGR